MTIDAKEVFSDLDRLREIGLGASEARTVAYLLKQCGWNAPDDIIKKDELVSYIMNHYKEGGKC